MAAGAFQRRYGEAAAALGFRRWVTQQYALWPPHAHAPRVAATAFTRFDDDEHFAAHIFAIDDGPT
jgi:hypothetical protein